MLTWWSTARAVEARARAEAATAKRIVDGGVNARGEMQGTKGGRVRRGGRGERGEEGDGGRHEGL